MAVAELLHHLFPALAREENDAQIVHSPVDPLQNFQGLTLVKAKFIGLSLNAVDSGYERIHAADMVLGGHGKSLVAAVFAQVLFIQKLQSG